MFRTSSPQLERKLLRSTSWSQSLQDFFYISEYTQIVLSINIFSFLHLLPIFKSPNYPLYTHVYTVKIVQLIKYWTRNSIPTRKNLCSRGSSVHPAHVLCDTMGSEYPGSKSCIKLPCAPSTSLLESAKPGKHTQCWAMAAAVAVPHCKTTVLPVTWGSKFRALIYIYINIYINTNMFDLFLPSNSWQVWTLYIISAVQFTPREANSMVFIAVLQSDTLRVW